jgi:hypothetical protein
MLYPVLAVCILTATFFVARYLAARTRLVEKAISDAIGRKLAASPLNNEISRLNEENSVMRNLLIDLVENEGSVATAMAPDDAARAVNLRTQRRREIFGEAVFVLQQTGKTRSQHSDTIIHG